jgi:aminoglycoside/choline kinase family phosphotransferase
MLMDAPPPHESTSNFQSVAEFLRNAGVNVPQIYASHHDHGFLLIEDLGALTFQKAFKEGFEEKSLYQEVINALVHLHKNVLKNKDFPVYSCELFLKEAELFLDWYDLCVSPQARADFKGLWSEAFHHQPLIPHSFVMRDVMVDNLIWLPSREGFQRCGFIDFQDGVWGPITYDLVSLLEDARRDISVQFCQTMVEMYLKAFPSLNPDDFWASFHFWGAQRCTKILGIFSRLAKRDGKPKYLTHFSRIKKILERDLSHPSLCALRQWYQKVDLW